MFISQAQQSVGQVMTTYGGFWSSSVDSVNPVKPDSNHVLLAFSYKSSLYSTGAGDLTLAKNKVSFKKTTFESFLLAGNAIQTSPSTKIGVGTKVGGYGNVTPVPVTNQLASYLTDGDQGLDLGTAIFNVPGSQMRYKVLDIKVARIADGIPDMLVTQVGAPPASNVLDTFRFEDSLGHVIGKAVSISMSGISIVGTGNWKFYDPGTTITYNAGLQGDRPLRMMAFELSDFELTATNISKIARFVHRVSGESDQAFVAYNSASFSAAAGTVLPVTLESFSARKTGEQARLDWSISASSRFSHFEIERSASGAAGFEAIGTVTPDNDGAARYSYTDNAPANGANHYRLKMVDLDGSFSFSPVQSLSFDVTASLSIYPNPASAALYVQGPSTGAAISLLSLSGAAVSVPLATEGSRTRMDVSGVPAGMYLIRITDGADTRTQRVLINH